MIPRNHQNRKVRANLRCPGCGLILTKAHGHIHNGETYCCQECAAGTPCVCAKPASVAVEDQHSRHRRMAESRQFIMRPRIR